MAANPNNSRARIHPGRRVRYLPTAGQITTYGDGHFVGQITGVSAAGAATIDVTGPNGTHFVVTGCTVGSNPGQYDFFGGVSP